MFLSVTGILLLGTGTAAADPVPAAPPPAASAVASPGNDPLAPPSSPSESQGLGTQKTVALVGAGVAIVGFGFAVGYGLDALSKKNDAQSVCPSSAVCPTAAGLVKWNNAQSSANVADVAFVVGCIGAIEAAVLWFTASSNHGDTQANTQIGLGPGAVQLRGTW
jgi:hypothetical protein